jgi:spermidine synthase
VESRNSSRYTGRLYAVNTLGAILGSICAAWLFLPLLGFAKTAWLIGSVVVMTGALLATGMKRYGIIFVGAAALLIAMMLETGIGKTRVQGFFATDRQGKPAQVLQYVEGPAATISAVQYHHDGARALLIGSSMAAIESGDKDQPASHYMAWMGHLPMMFHPDPKKALVICFGTGQTSNAVRKENPDELDIVDINPNVFALAHHFKSNEGVLNDPRVKAIVMDGRAYMRRTKKTYDVITLEPMPPISVGVNALYSREFYALARKRLSAHGVIAQWLPFHVAAPHYTASIAKTFIDVFPNAVLWIDDVSNTGILIGTKSDHPLTSAGLSGYLRTNIKRNLSQNEVERSMALDSKQLAQYARYGEVITDDNQLLAYGKALSVPGLLVDANFALLRRINSKIIIPEFDREFP